MKNQPLILAHRGANQYAPQNTIPAFKKAIELGADGVEFDVQMTLDGVLVVCHNFTVDQTSDGSGFISEMAFSELRQLDFGSWFSPEFSGTKIPTLEEVLDTVKDMKLINIEIKRPSVPHRQDVVQKTVDTIRRYSISDHLVVSSFDYCVIDEVKRIAPEIKCGLLYSFRDRKRSEMDRGKYLTMVKQHRAKAVHPTYNYLFLPIYLLRCKIHHVDINAWGVKKPEHMKYVKKIPVNSIITDYLD